ncbi:MAG: HAD hydrolase-like protein [Eubacteriales bacterium]
MKSRKELVMRRYDYVLFDLDGTLTDPFEGITGGVQYALRQLGRPVPPKEQLTGFIGPPLQKQFQQFCGISSEQAAWAVEQYRVYFADRGIFENRLYEGIPQLLEALCEAGQVLLVASSKPQVFVERILEHFHIRQYFTYVAGSELSGARVEKEEVIAHVLRQAGVAPGAAAVMVGDRCFDVEGAHQLGLPCIGVSFGYGGREELERAGADGVADTVQQLQCQLLEDCS